MKKNKIIGLFPILLFIFSFTGCVKSQEAIEIENRGVEVVKDYYKQKYKEDINLDDYRYSVVKDIIGSAFNGYENEVSFYNKKDDTYICVDMDNSVVYDNIQAEEILADLKDYIQKEYFEKNSIYLENSLGLDIDSLGLELYETEPKMMGSGLYDFFGVNAYYNGNIEEFIKNNEFSINLDVHFKADKEVSSDTYIQEMENYESKFKPVIEAINRDFGGSKFNSFVSFYIYAPDKYMNEDVMAVLDEQKTRVSISHRYIYDSDFVYMTIDSSKEKGTNEWNTSYLYDKYIEIDEGLYVSSNKGRVFEAVDDVNCFKYPIYELFTNTTVLSNSDFSTIIDEDLLNKYKTNLEGETVISNLYTLNYNKDKFPDSSNYSIAVKIDKEKFENGALLDENNFIKTVYPDRSNNENFKTDGLAKSSDRYIYFSVDKDENFAIIKRP